MRTAVQFRPASLYCQWDYRACGSFDPGSRVVRRELSKLPCWELRGEDGTVIGVCREGDALMGFTQRPGERRRVAYGDGARCDGLIVGRGGRFEPSEREMRVMNRVLLPHVLDRPWPELEAEATPCDHLDEWCVVNPAGRWALEGPA